MEEQLSPLAYNLLSLLTQMPQIAAVGWGCCRLLRTARSGRFIAIFMPLSLVCTFLSDWYLTGIVFPWLAVAMYALMLLMMFIFNRGVKPIRILAAFITVQVGMFISELVVSPLSLALFGPDYYLRFISTAVADLPLMIFMRLVVVCVLVIFYSLADKLLWNRRLAATDVRAIGPFLPFIAMQCLVALVFLMYCLNYPPDGNVLVTVMLVVIGSLLADVFLLRAMQRLNQGLLLEEKAALLAAQLQSQGDYYRRLLDSIQATRKQRHDYRNQLQVLLGLLQDGQTPAAVSLLEQLTDNIAATEQEQYCQHPVVNAVVAGPAKLCHQRHIDFQAQLRLPPTLPVSDLDLCSLFANLLDNGVEAASVSDAAKPFVEIKAALRGPSLAVSLTNSKDPSVRPQAEGWRSQKGQEEHGWGLSIIRDVVSRYQGDLETEDRGTQMYMVAILNFPPAAEQ